ncbi:MAG: hypothetical protein DMF68_01500 [Acidobacteria bacterium]|nr:MAG: hypothetical protein DMF68_01500 [Acidobacteriota bacterium]
MNKVLLAIAFILLSISLAAPQHRRPEPAPDDWLIVTLTKNKAYFYKPSQVRKIGRIRKVWLKGIPAGEEDRLAYIEKQESIGAHVDYSGYVYSMAFWDVDCTQDKLRIIEVKDYNQYNQLIFSAKPKRLEWVNIVPDSVGDNLSKLVCK